MNDFIYSLRNQSRKDFDLIVVNDGYSNKNIQSLYPDLNIVELEFVPQFLKIENMVSII